MRLRILTAAITLALFSLPAFAQDKPKSCDELKMEITAKIDAKGVKSYELTIVKNDEVKKDDTVVGSCEGGTKKIIYVRK